MPSCVTKRASEHEADKQQVVMGGYKLQEHNENNQARRGTFLETFRKSRHGRMIPSGTQHASPPYQSVLPTVRGLNSSRKNAARKKSDKI